jgi:16S rRNA (adenine1518-N6/adenine1519-N6)-dimethyltransferase
MGIEQGGQSLPAAPNLKSLCQQYGIRFKKSLGQNLLLDDNINRIMVDAAAITKEDDVMEVGAGLGALTAPLCPAWKTSLGNWSMSNCFGVTS